MSLEKLNSGGAKTVAVERRRVRPDGAEFLSTKNIHLVVRWGSLSGGGVGGWGRGRAASQARLLLS